MGLGTKIVRTWEELRGRVTVETERIGERLFRVTVQVANETPWQGSERKDALRRAFCSTHVVLHANEGAFVSLTDPPAEHDEADLAEKVKAPLLALWGAHGRIAPAFDVLATWRERAADVRGPSLPCGHFLAEEAPDETVQALESFFRS